MTVNIKPVSLIISIVTLTRMTVRKMTQRTKVLIATLTLNGTQHNDT
jgi:hypothetical protein